MQIPIAFDRPLALLLIPILGCVFWLIASKSYAGIHPQTLRLALITRLTAVVLLVMAISGIHIIKRTDKLATIFLVDVSKSIRPEQRALGLQFVQQALASKHKDDAAGIIVFGRTSFLEEPPQSSIDNIGDLHAAVPGDATDLQDALRTADAALPADAGRKIVLVTDGNENIGDAASEIESLRAKGIRVDIASAPLNLDKKASVENEALVESVQTPTQVKASSPFPVHAIISSTVAQNAKVTLLRDGKSVSTQKVKLKNGKSSVDFQERIADAGFHRYEVHLEPETDTVSENDQGYGYVAVKGKPRLLYVTNNETPSETLKNVLKAQGIDVTTISPGAIPGSVAEMASYDEILLSDVTADDIGPQKMTMLESSVRDFGIGLGMIGGRNSYASGGYIGTPIETALPVSMEVKDRKRIPPAAIALVIEDLEEPTTVNWSIEAAKSAIDLMEPQDQVGILDCNGTWRVEMQYVKDKQSIKSQLDTLEGMGDPPSYNEYIDQAANVVDSTNAPIKHVIFFGDGDAIGEAEQSLDVLKKIRARGITVSTITTGGDSEGIKFMQAIAQLGGGHAYVAEKATDLPGLLLKDQQTVTRQYFIEKPFKVERYSWDDTVAGIDWQSAPPLLGYNITSRKPGGTVILTSPQDHDPIYARWRYGLGRSFSFTSDDRAHWASYWLPWDGYNRFWSQAVRWALKSNSEADFHADLEYTGGAGHISVDAYSQGGYSNNAKLIAKVVSPDGTSGNVSLSQTAPGHYEGNFDTDQTGSYMVSVRHDSSNNNAPASSQTLGLVVPYSPEYRNITPGLPLLTRLTESTGGTFQSDPTRIFKDAPTWVVGSVDYAPLFIALVALLFLFDIAARKLGLRLEKITAAAAQGVEQTSTKIADIRKSRAQATPSTAQMSRLLERKTSSRVPTQEDDDSVATSRLLNRRAVARPDADDDNPFPQVASLRKTQSSKPAEGNDGSYTNRLLEAKRRAQNSEKE